MNGVRQFASGGVQRAATNVACMISEPGHSTGDARGSQGAVKQEETTMLKTISAALVAVSVLAAPALAGTPSKTAQAPTNKTTQAPVNKTTQAPESKTAQAPAIKAEQGKSKALNANARMGRHHKHYRHHRHHKHIGLHKMHAKPHVAIKHVTPTAKRS
jgi:hypothetical protein